MRIVSWNAKYQKRDRNYKTELSRNSGLENYNWKEEFNWGLSSRSAVTEERICKPEDRLIEYILFVEQKGKGMKIKKQSVRDLWDTIQHTSIWIMGVQKEGRKKGTGRIVTPKMVENFPNLISKN